MDDIVCILFSAYLIEILQLTIEVFLRKQEDGIVGTNLGVEGVDPRPMSKANEIIVVVALFKEMDEDKLRKKEKEYGVKEFVSIEVLVEHLKAKKPFDMASKPIRFSQIFSDETKM